MNQSALDSPEPSPERLQALADQIVSHQSSIENFYLNSAIDFWFLHRLGLEPLSVPGRLVGGIFHVLTFGSFQTKIRVVRLGSFCRLCPVL